MWSSTAVFCAFFVLSAHSCGVPQTTQVPSTEAPTTEAPTSTTTLPTTTTTTAQPTGTECEAPTYVDQNTKHSIAGKMTMTQMSKTRTDFRCNAVDLEEHFSATSIEYMHYNQAGDLVNMTQEVVPINAGGSMTWECHKTIKKYVQSHEGTNVKVVNRVRCSSFIKTTSASLIENDLENTPFPKAL